ncbi:unnamed protein product [Dibothriocephalus latus]|uniref:Uncharacterized protein n=1 Tax=Dibothriocephalus latus TaxID=60516 RepID=A0A3P7N2D4_DIBLA|nr:unnamed protein product [Dibothriocephalus latus]
MRPSHTFKFDEAEILARDDNRVSRELLESWFTDPQSINKCNALPNPYSVLRLNLTKVSRRSGNAQATASSYANTGEPDGRVDITSNSTTRDESSACPHAGYQAINTQAGHHP